MRVLASSEFSEFGQVPLSEESGCLDAVEQVGSSGLYFVGDSPALVVNDGLRDLGVFAIRYQVLWPAREWGLRPYCGGGTVNSPYELHSQNWFACFQSVSEVCVGVVLASFVNADGNDFGECWSNGTALGWLTIPIEAEGSRRIPISFGDTQQYAWFPCLCPIKTTYSPVYEVD